MVVCLLCHVVNFGSNPHQVDHPKDVLDVGEIGLVSCSDGLHLHQAMSVIPVCLIGVYLMH